MILVLGANGTTGSLVVDELVRRGERPKVMVRDEARARARWAGQPVTIVTGDMADAAALDRALAGVSRVYQATAAQPALLELELGVLRACQARRIELLVNLGGIRADDERSPVLVIQLHARSQRAIAESGVPYVNLRPNFFLQNLLLSAPAIAAGVLPAPTGNAAFSFIDARDIALAAATVLTTAGHAGRTYDLTGDEALTFGEVATVATEVLGRAVKHADLPTAAFRAAGVEAGLPPWLVDRFCELYEHAKTSDHFRAPTTDFRRIAGRPARTLRAFLEEHRSAFATSHG